MHKITAILLIVFTALPAVSMADTDPGEDANNKAQQSSLVTHAGEKNPLAFCYFEDKAYSEGAAVGEMLCERRESINAFVRSKEPLCWKNSNPKTIKR